MALKKLADELEETARQTAEMVDGITAALQTLSRAPQGCEVARSEAIRMIVKSLQAQDRIDQRSRNLAQVMRQFADLADGSPQADYAALWQDLTMDELRRSSEGAPSRPPQPDIELF